MVGALEVLAAELSREGKGEVLAALLDLDDYHVRTRVLGAAVNALGAVWGIDDEATSRAESVVEALANAALASTQRSERFNQLAESAQIGHSPLLCGRSFTRAGMAVERARQAVLRWRVEAEPHRPDLQRDLAWSLRMLGLHAWGEGGLHEAREVYEECLQLRRRLLEAAPDRSDLQIELCQSLNDLGHVAFCLGNPEQSRSFFEECLLLRRRLVEAEPERVDRRVDLATSYWEIYWYEMESEPTQALILLLDTLRPLREQGVDPEQTDELWERVTREIGKWAGGEASG